MLEEGEGGEIGVIVSSVQLQLDGEEEITVPPAFSTELELMLTRFGTESWMMMRTVDRGEFMGNRLPID